MCDVNRYGTIKSCRYDNEYLINNWKNFKMYSNYLIFRIKQVAIFQYAWKPRLLHTVSVVAWLSQMMSVKDI